MTGPSFVDLPEEIQCAVFDCFNDKRADRFQRAENRKTLHTALLVDKAWFRRASKLLWQEPPIIAFTSIPSRTRQQFYASHVLELYLGRGHYHTRVQMAELNTLAQLQFPRLRKWWIDELPLGVGPELYSRILKNLRSLRSIRVEECSDPNMQPLLAALADYNPGVKQLEKLELSGLYDSLRSEHPDYLNLLQKCVSLREVDFQVCNIDARVIEDIFAHLASCRNLEAVSGLTYYAWPAISNAYKAGF